MRGLSWVVRQTCDSSLTKEGFGRSVPRFKKEDILIWRALGFLREGWNWKQRPWWCWSSWRRAEARVGEDTLTCATPGRCKCLPSVGPRGMEYWRDLQARYQPSKGACQPKWGKEELLLIKLWQEIAFPSHSLATILTFGATEAAKLEFVVNKAYSFGVCCARVHVLSLFLCLCVCFSVCLRLCLSLSHLCLISLPFAFLSSWVISTFGSRLTSGIQLVKLMLEWAMEKRAVGADSDLWGPAFSFTPLSNLIITNPLLPL